MSVNEKQKLLEWQRISSAPADSLHSSVCHRWLLGGGGFTKSKADWFLCNWNTALVECSQWQECHTANIKPTDLGSCEHAHFLCSTHVRLQEMLPFWYLFTSSEQHWFSFMSSILWGSFAVRYFRLMSLFSWLPDLRSLWPSKATLQSLSGSFPCLSHRLGSNLKIKTCYLKYICLTKLQILSQSEF